MSIGVPRSCSFLTNHTRVLMAIDRDPMIRVRDLAQTVQVTERAVQGIIVDLVAAGCLTRVRVGRRNRYVVHYDTVLDDPRDAHLTVGDLLRVMPPQLERSLASV